MDTVTESRMAIAMAQKRWYRYFAQEHGYQRFRLQEVRRVKKFEASMVKDPIIQCNLLKPQYVNWIALTQANNISGVPVVKDGKVVGIVTGRDTRFETNLEQPVSNIMTGQDRLVKQFVKVKSKKKIPSFIATAPYSNSIGGSMDNKS